jgi:hypothetical protein
MDTAMDDTPAPEGDSTLFQLLALSLANAALIGLGRCTDPTQGIPTGSIKLEMAKQNIDLLEMLESKTAGNLNPEERQLLQGLLFDLRLKYVDAGKLP